MRFESSTDGRGPACRAPANWHAPHISTLLAQYVYAGGIYEEESTACGAPYIVTKHYNAFGRVTAQRRGATLSYLLADHLSSTVGAVSASTGSVTQRARPAPVHVSVCVGRERTRGP